MDLPYEVGALYSRKEHIHGVFGGQEQGGISTPKDHPLIIAFTGEAGVAHGYQDFRDDDDILHYYGEGQVGDMRYVAGNKAIEQHVADGKTLVVFQAMGKGRPYRYLGEFISLSSYMRPNAQDREGNLRKAIVFRLKPLAADWGATNVGQDDKDESAGATPLSTSELRLVETRTKQRLFRDRLLTFEKGCRLTGIEDLRFLRASHIKPWSYSNDQERVDGENGLLLAPHADLLFDRGWISFEDNGSLLVSKALPVNVTTALRLGLRAGQRYGSFSQTQRNYLELHRSLIFDRRRA